MAFCTRALSQTAGGWQGARLQGRKYESVGDKKMKSSRKAQVAMEYMILVGFLVVITIPLILVYNTQYKGTNIQIISNQADQIGQKIVDTAESVYYLGQPSKTTLKVYMPQQIENVVVGNNEITFRVIVNNGIDEVVKMSSVPINGTLKATSGMHYITVQSVGSYVNISST